MDLRDWLERRPKDTAEKAAKKLLKEHPDAALAMIADRIAHMRREWARETEARAAAAIFALTPSKPITIRSSASLEAFQALMSQPFAIGDGTEVTWGFATIEHHQVRIGLLTKQRDGIERTIKLHEHAVSLLRDTGAICLAKVGETAVAAA